MIRVEQAGGRGTAEARLPGDGVVTLGLFRPSDAPVMRDGDRDAEHRRRFEFPEDFVPSLRHSRDVLAQWERKRAAGERFPFAVRDAVTGELLGGCELRPVGKGAANLAYWTYPAHRSRGVASRGVALACRIAFERLRFRRLEVVTDPDNGSSRRVALRNGFREAGVRGGRILHIKESATDSRVGRSGSRGRIQRNTASIPGRSEHK